MSEADKVVDKAVEKELSKDVKSFGAKRESKKKGDIVKVKQSIVDANPGLFLDVGEAKRKLASSGDVKKLQARVKELEAQNKALLEENQTLKAG